MTNSLTNIVTNDPCPQCGLNMVLVGRRHRCRERVSAVLPSAAAAPKAAVKSEPVVSGSNPTPYTGAPKSNPPVRPHRAAPGTALYRYRRADEWRAYQRELMRRHE